MVAIVAPLLARRRYPFWALAAVPVAVGISSPLDPRLVPDNGITFAVGLSVTFLFAQLRNVRQALAGLVMIFGVEVVIVRFDPQGHVGDIVFTNVVFGVVWVAGCLLGRKFVEADAAEERAARLEEAREDQARIAVFGDRARFGRELLFVICVRDTAHTVQAS